MAFPRCTCGGPTPGRFRAALRWGLLLILLAAVPAQATSWQDVSLPSLCRHAGLVVVGRVNHVVSLWAPDGHDIFTYVTLTLERTLKGRAERTEAFTVRFRGGRAGHLTSVVAGAPRLQAGERVVLFLTAPDADGFPRVLGLRHGVWRVRSGRVVAPGAAGRVPAAARIRAAGEAPAPPGAATVAPADSAEDLPHFLDRVERLCGGSTSPEGKR
jgi:hypothetical protein